MNRNKLISNTLYSSFLLMILLSFISCSGNEIKSYKNIERQPKIFPDYNGIVLPPNIAPLNFMINEQGKNYYAEIITTDGNILPITGHGSQIMIPEGEWRKILANNKGKKYKVDVFVEKESGWVKYKSIENEIAREEIDNHLAYRLIQPSHNYWVELGIYQRDLETFDEEPILINKLTEDNCMNCHSFRCNNPNSMMLHLRGGKTNGTLFYTNNKFRRVDTKTSFNKAGSYPSWHPNGKIVAFSVNNLLQFFHSTGESRDVLDRSSDIVIYSIDDNMITSCMALSDLERMETFPAWSYDGKYLYFCSAPKLENYTVVKGGKEDLAYDKIFYDLNRIEYNAETKTWGKLETILPASKLGKSLTEPRPSPDGRSLLFTVSDYGNFPIYLKSSDVYVLNLKTGVYYKSTVNSDRTDSFHSWSSNGRWFVFSSKRVDGVLARPYFSYFDELGIAHKPFVLPQEEPGFYSSFLKTFNVPELIKGKVTVKMQDLVDAAFDTTKFMKAKLDPNIQNRKTQSAPEAMWRSAKK